ncbi:MAG TPA: DUF4145 domain-containing protein, partial [Edaphobacter sp.]|nr:DUF4145 domain-containing protein [Edaphobacter sp.]
SEARLICPHCKTASTLLVRTQTFEKDASGTLAYLVLQCNVSNCRKLLFIRTTVRRGYSSLQPDDDFFMYPFAEVDVRHPSIPTSIAEDWEEAQKAMYASAPKAAAVMFRRVLYGALLDKNCKLHPLREGMKELIATQRLPGIFDEWLPAIKDDGHDAAHPDRALQISPTNVAETMEYTSELLRYLYVEPYDFLQRKLRNTQPVTSTTQP